MGLRTAGEFVNSLKDSRIVYYKGKRVEDVTIHPALRIGIQTASIDYQVTEDIECSEFAVCQKEDGQLYSRFFHSPQSLEDLLKRYQLVGTGSRLACGFPTFSKEGGTDGMLAMTVAAGQMDKAIGTGYGERIAKWRKHLEDNDLSVAIAMTDVKGSRSLRPSQQDDLDLYVRVVEKRSDGLLIRGAKAHITTAPYTNEILVLPTRNMNAEEKDYAVAFAIPADHPGIKMICRPTIGEERDPFDYPISSKYDIIEAMVIFDDVLVPWERVFMFGEHQYTGLIGTIFANFHRVTAAVYKYSLAELLVGSAHLMAEYNGSSKIGHVRDKLASMVLYTETIDALIKSACFGFQTDQLTGIVYPNPMYSNAVKYFFANNFHSFIKDAQDIAGGILVTAPSFDDWNSPEISSMVHKYMAGEASVPAEHRFRIIRLLRDLTASDLSGFWEVAAIHAEGSLASFIKEHKKTPLTLGIIVLIFVFFTVVYGGWNARNHEGNQFFQAHNFA